MISSQGAGVASSSSNRRVSLGTTVTSASEEMHHCPQQNYRRQHQEKRNASYPDYHEAQSHHHHNNASQFHQHHVSAPRSKKSYPGSNPRQHADDSAYHQYYHYGSEEKENFPSPPTAYSYDDHNHYHQPPVYDRSSYSLQQGPHISSHQNQGHPPYYNEEWHMHHGGYYYQQGSPDISYQKNVNGVASSNVYHEGERLYTSSGVSDTHGLSFIDHTYRDFSGVPPTEEDRERYNNKKNEYNRRMREQKNATRTGSNKDADHDRALKKKRGRGNRATKSGSTGFIGFMGTNFPARLHDLLSHEEEISSIITWLPHGRSWIVLDKNEFLNKVAPSHFQISKFESFTRQVNGWGFKRITQGPDINSYYHELFLRGMPHLIQWMKRSTSSGPGKRKIRADPKDEPDFYSISQMYPIPNYYGEHWGQQVSAEPVHVDSNGSGKKKEENDEPRCENFPSSTIRPSKRSKAEKDSIKKITPSSSSSSPEENEMPKLSSFSSSSAQFDCDPNGAHYFHPGPFQGIDHAADTTHDIVYSDPPPTGSPPRLHPNDVTQVKNFWTGSDPYNNSTSIRHQHQHQRLHHQGGSSGNHHDNSYYNDHSYDDFKPLEGTIGDRETFRWDDADYVRQRTIMNYNHNNNNDETKHHNDSSTKNGESVKFLDPSIKGEDEQQNDSYPGSCSVMVSTDDSLPVSKNCATENWITKRRDDKLQEEIAPTKNESSIISKESAFDNERTKTNVTCDSSCNSSSLTKKSPSRVSMNDKDIYDGSIQDIMSDKPTSWTLI